MATPLRRAVLGASCWAFACACATIPDFKVAGDKVAGDADIPQHYVFLSMPVAGDFAKGAASPQLEASRRCKAEADLQPRLRGRTWRASLGWFSFENDAGGLRNGGPASVRQVRGGWYTLDNKLLIGTLQPQPSASAQLPLGIVITLADGTAATDSSDSNVWSGDGGSDCVDWTSASSGDGGIVGNAFRSTFGAWVGLLGHGDNISCDQKARFICFEQE